MRRHVSYAERGGMRIQTKDHLDPAFPVLYFVRVAAEQPVSMFSCAPILVSSIRVSRGCVVVNHPEGWEIDGRGSASFFLQGRWFLASPPGWTLGSIQEGSREERRSMLVKKGDEALG